MNCRACDTKLPKPFIDLGKMPLANSYLRKEEIADEQTFPLAVAHCKKCHLVQLTETVPPEAMFTNYAYSSSYSTTFLAHAEKMANEIMHDFLPTTGNVLEIGSNDGYLLQYFKQARINVLGVDPAMNIAEKASAKGIPTLNEFFNLDTVPKILNVWGKFDVIIGNNVFAHVPDVNNFLEAVKLCMNSTGVAIFEFPYLPCLLQNREFDTIYHEHVFYYSIIALKNLLKRHGLEIMDVKFFDIHGGSIRIFVTEEGSGPVFSTVSLYEYSEHSIGINNDDIYEVFGFESKNAMDDLRTNLQRLRAQKKSVAAYGAPAKGNTLLNAAHIGRDLIDFTVDRNPDKQGLYLPGSHIPIFEVEALGQARPDYALILPWNVAEEIQEQQAAYINRGGKFITPIPYFRILNE